MAEFHRQNIIDSVLSKPPRQPNWETYKDVSKAVLWELVALSCNYDPNDIRGWKLGIAKSRAPDDFQNRLRQAISHFAKNDEDALSDNIEFSNVKLNDFKKWAESVDITLPNDSVFYGDGAKPKETIAERDARIFAHYIELSKAKPQRQIKELVKAHGLTEANIKKIIYKAKSKNRT